MVSSSKTSNTLVQPTIHPEICHQICPHASHRSRENREMYRVLLVPRITIIEARKVSWSTNNSAKLWQIVWQTFPLENYEGKSNFCDVLVHQSCGSDTCRPQTSIHEHCRATPNLRPPLTPPELRRPGSSFDHHIPKIEPDTTPSTPPTPPSR